MAAQRFHVSVQCRLVSLKVTPSMYSNVGLGRGESDSEDDSQHQNPSKHAVSKQALASHWPKGPRGFQTHLYLPSRRGCWCCVLCAASPLLPHHTPWLYVSRIYCKNVLFFLSRDSPLSLVILSCSRQIYATVFAGLFLMTPPRVNSSAECPAPHLTTLLLLLLCCVLCCAVLRWLIHQRTPPSTQFS